MTESKFSESPQVERDFSPMIGRKVAIACGVALALAIGLVAGYRAWLRAQIRAQITEIKKAHLPVTLADLNDWYKAVPARENAAIQFLDNFYAIKPGSNETKIPIVGNGVLPKTSEAINGVTQAQIAKYLANSSNALQALHRAVQLDKSRYPIDLEFGAATLLPHLNRIREAQNLLQLDAVFASEIGDDAGALEAVLDQLRLARSLRNEPVMISQIIRLCSIFVAIQSVERIISILPLSDGEIDQLSAVMLETEGELADCWQHLMVGERSMGIDIFQMPLPKVMQMMNDFDSASGGPLYSFVLTARRAVGIWDADFLFFLKTIARANSLAARNYPESIREAANITSTTTRLNSSHTISALLMPNFESGISKLVGTQAALRACRLALAIEKYRTKKGHPPEDLQQLVPEYLKTLPLDPGNDSPFRYTLRETGYTIQSTLPKASATTRLREFDASGNSEGNVAFVVERRR